MNLKTLMKSVLMTALLLGLMSIASFAQVYVNNTNGDDQNGQGTSLQPYKTISKALSVVPAGGTINIAADTYPEGNVAVTKAVTLVATPFASLSTVTITNGITINTANSSDVVNLGRAADNSVAFKIGAGNLINALVLQKGNLQISTANVIIADNGTITRIGGTLDNAPTVSNVNVVYTSTSDVTAGGELPSNIGTGSLNINIAAGKTLTINNSVATTGGVTVTTGNASFGGNLNLTISSLTNIPANNTVTVAGTVALTTGKIVNQNTGSLTIGGNVTWTMAANVAGNAIDNQGNGTLTINGAVAFVKASTGAGNYTASINNNGTGTLTLTQGFTLTSASIGTPAVTYTPVVSAVNIAGGTLAFNGAVALTALTNTAAGKIVLTGGKVLGAVANDNAGTIELLANLSYEGTAFSNNNAGSVVKLNSNTLTFTKDNVILTNAGKIISGTPATVGNGTLAFTGTTTAGTITNGIELPNITLSASKKLTVSAANIYGSVTNNGTMTLTATKVFGNVTNAGAFTSAVGTIAGNIISSGAFASAVALTVEGDITSSAAFTLQGNLIVKGNYAQNVGASLALGANRFEAWGNWIRTSNVPGDVTYAAGAELLFNKGNAQTFTPGASLKLNDVRVTKDAGTVVTMSQSLQVENNFTISTGKVDLGDFNIRMIGAAGIFTNNGNFYSTTGNGYMIFEGAGAAYGITGTGSFSNMDIRSGSTVTAGSDINFSGNLILRNGVLAVGVNTFTYKNDIVPVPTVTRHIGTGTMTVGAGTIQVANGVVYDLTYIGDADGAVAAEWIPNGIRNLTIDTGDKDATNPSSRTVSGPTADFTIYGNLSVNVKQTLDLGTHKLTFGTDGKVHAIVGKVTNGTIDVTGDNVAINGSTDTKADAEIPTTSISIAAAKSFTSANLKKVNGNITVANGTATVNMNAKTATVTGDVTLTAGTLALNMNSETSVHGGNLVLAAGSMTYTRNTDGSAAASNRTIGGNVTLTAGTLSLGSTVLVSGTTSQVDGGIALNNNNYVQLGSAASPDFTRTGTGTIAGAGIVVFDGTGSAIDVTPGASFSIPNVEFKGANGTVLNGALTVSNSLLHTSGPVALNTLTVTGNTYTYKNGTYTSGTLVLQGANTVATLYGDVTVPNFVLNTDGKVTLASNNTTKRTLTIGTAFTQTIGELAQGINDLIVAGDYTRAAGTISQSSGTLVFNTAGAIDLGDGFVIDNMKVAQTIGFGTKALTVNKYLTLASGVLTTSADGKLTLATGATVERQAAGATLSKVPAFGSDISVLYSTAGAAITTAKELPGTVKNLTVNMPAGGSVILADNLTVNGTLSLNKLFDATTTSNVKVTMADNSTLELKADGNTVLDENLTKAGKLNIVYNGAANTTTRELGLTTNANTHTAGNVTFKSNVVLDAAATFTGEVKFDGGSIDNNGKDLFVEGNVTETANGGFFAPSSASNLYFSGANNTKLTLNTSKNIPVNLDITLKKASGVNTVTLIGGNLDFHANAKKLYFNNGLLVTGSNFVKVWAPLFGGGQGFDRSGVVGANTSHIVGNVKKQLVSNGTISGSTEQRSVFPVGSLTMYRPAAITFNPQNGGISNVQNTTLVVSHVDSTATGTVGLPIVDGVQTGTNVSRYPNFYWNLSSEPDGITPSIVFDLELSAAGFTNFDNVTNIRTIRRNGTINDVTNPWLVQGGIGSQSAYYDNNVLNGIPTIVVRNATGGIIAGGAVFTLGLKSNMTVANPITAKDITMGSTLKIALANVVTGNSGPLTYTAQSSNVSVATVAVNADTLTVSPVAPGNADISVTAKDVNNDFITTKFAVKVNPVTNFTVKGKVTYANTAVTALKDVKITLTPGNLTATTDASGNYAILNVPNGTYTVTATSAAPWLGIGTITGGDALLAAQYTVDPVKYALSDIQVNAADVNVSNTVNASDALLIQRRVVGLDKSFAKGDWTFSTKNITVAGADVTVDIKGIAVGDVNASYAPATLAKTASFVNEGSLKVAPGSAIQVPVKVDAQNLAAVTLKFKYSEELGQFTGVSSKLNGLLANAENGVVTICWADLSGKASVNADSKEALITLNFKSTENFKAGSSFSLDMNDAELVSADGKIMNSTLKSATVDAVVPTEFALSQNYPNPFNPTTTIQYDLPMNAHVTLTVTNILGQEVVTLVNAVEDAGTHKVQFNANNITSGIYFYTINASNGDHKFSKTYKMMLMK